MREFNFIKNFLTINFGGDKKIEVAGGNNSEGVLILSSPLAPKAIDLSKDSSQKGIQRKKLVKKTDSFWRWGEES